MVKIHELGQENDDHDELARLNLFIFVLTDALSCKEGHKKNYVLPCPLPKKNQLSYVSNRSIIWLYPVLLKQFEIIACLLYYASG